MGVSSIVAGVKFKRDRLVFFSFLLYLSFFFFAVYSTYSQNKYLYNEIVKFALISHRQ